MLYAPSPAHLHLPSTLEGFGLPEICFIFIQSLRKQSASQRRDLESAPLVTRSPERSLRDVKLH